MALVLAMTLGLTAYAVRSWGRPWFLPAAVFAATALLLYPVATTRYDAVVALALAATVTSVAASRRSYAALAAWAFLGFGAAAKLVPALATLPLALVMYLRTTARSVAWGFGVFLCVAAGFFLPAYVLGGAGFIESFAYHADRGLQLESLSASALMQLGWLESAAFEYGAFEARGRGVEFLTSMSLPVTGVLLAVTAVVMLRERHRVGPEFFPRFAAAFVLAFMLGSKVLSPQYMIWLLPLIPLSAGGVWGLVVFGVFSALCWTTTEVYAHHYGELVNLRSPATDLLVIRNILLVVLWALILSLPSGGKEVLSGRFTVMARRNKEQLYSVVQGLSARRSWFVVRGSIKNTTDDRRPTTDETPHSRLTAPVTIQEHEPSRVKRRPA